MQDNFSQQAETYAKYRPAYPQQMYDFIFRHVQHKHIAWDCGTGSGQVASVLAEQFEKVYASDISPEQMKYAPDKSNITYVKTPAENTPFPDGRFDLITVGQAIHWFDFDRFYREVNRTAKNGGLLAVIGYGMVRINAQLNPLIDAFYERAFAEYFRENRRYLDEHYQTIPFPFEEIDAPDFSITYDWDIEELEGYFNSWSAVQKIKEEQSINPVEEVMEKIGREWMEDGAKEATFSVFLRLGRI